MNNKKKLKVLMLLDLDFPKDERVDKESQTLVKAGYDLTICCTNFQNRKHKETINNVKIIRINISNYFKNKIYPFIATLPFYQWYWIFKLKRTLKEGNYDIVHCHDLPMCSIGSYIKKKYPKIKFIADQHENYPALLGLSPFMENKFINYLVNIKAWYNAELKWLKNADGIIVTARGMKERLVSVGLQNSNWAILENTIQLSDFVETKDSPDMSYKTLFYSGGMNKHRGLQIALEGYRIVKEKYPELRFWLVGDGRFVRSLKKQIVEHNIKDVKFWGWVSTQEMFEIMQQADVCLIPHFRSEHTDNTSPNKIFHYFRARKPILVSNCNYLVDKIKESNAGYYYENRSPEGFAKKLEKLISNEQNIDFGKNGLDIVMNRFNWNKTSDYLLQFYSKLH